MLIDKLRIGLVIDEISDEQMVVGIFPLSLHHCLLLQTDSQMPIHFDYGLADAADALRFVSEEITAQEDRTAYFALLAMHIHFGFGISSQKFLDSIQSL